MPDLSAFTGLFQITAAIVVLGLAGRLVTAGRGGPGLQVVAGWGALCLVLTLWGVVTAASLRLPAAAFALAALGGLMVRSGGRGRDDLVASGRMLAVSLPLLAVMATLQASQIDVFNLMLPNSAYLYDHAMFPSATGAPAYSDLPVAPYNTELVPFLGSLAGGGWAPNGLALFTIVLHLAAGLIFARALTGTGRPGWAALALGLLLATLLNPGFVPRVAFAGYGEAPLTIGLLLCGILAVEATEDLAAGRRWPPALVPLALTLAAMINTKQQAPGLLAAFLAAATIVAARGGGLGWGRGVRLFAAAAVPAACLYLAWRGYVQTRFPTGELKINPVEEWHLATLGRALGDIGHVVFQKPFQFGCQGAVFALVLARPRWLSRPALLTAKISAGTFLFYTAFLLVIYVVHFQDEHDFFRYNTHLSLLIVLALALAARDRLAAAPPPRWMAHARMATVGVMLVAPLATVPLLRFDLAQPQPRARFAIRHLADSLANGPGNADHLAMMLPGDNKTARNVLTAMLRFLPPRHRDIRIATSYTVDEAAFAGMAADGYSLAFLSCTDKSPFALPPDSAALLSYASGTWSPVAIWPYPRAPKKHWWNWTGYVAAEPFCLTGQ